MARKLADQVNVVAAGGDYPLARIKDNPGDGSGTAVNEALYGDMHQFFARILQLSGVAPNGLPDNAYSGYQLVEALTKYFSADGRRIVTKVFDIGDWNMNSSAAGTTLKTVNHDLNPKQIRSVDFAVRNDADSAWDTIASSWNTAVPNFDLELRTISSTSFTLFARATGVFDAATYDSTSYNRGFVTVLYEPA